jgi:hypothetical protein
MSITDTVSGARETAIKRISEAKTDRTAKQVEELRTENRLLRDELAENRSERKQVLDLLDKAQISVGGRSKRRFKVLRLVAAGGAVYAVATQTGAVDRIKGWIDSMRGRSEELGSDFASKGSEMTHGAADAMEQTGRKLKQSGRKLEQTSRKLDETAGRIGQPTDGTER